MLYSRLPSNDNEETQNSTFFETNNFALLRTSSIRNDSSRKHELRLCFWNELVLISFRNEFLHSFKTFFEFKWKKDVLFFFWHVFGPWALKLLLDLDLKTFSSIELGALLPLGDYSTTHSAPTSLSSHSFRPSVLLWEKLILANR